MSFSFSRQPTTGGVRRGPTMRGRGYRSVLGRRTERRSESDEETIALNQRNDDTEMEHFESVNTARLSGSYQHGPETFGDVLSHPLTQYKEHRQRKQLYEEQLEKEKQAGGDKHVSTADRSSYVLVIHFRQLLGNQSFVLDHDTAEAFATKMCMTPQERIQFNGVRDTDGLTDFLHRTKREFSIKIHKKTEIAQPQTDLVELIRHHSDHDVIVFSENVCIEFKPHRSKYLPLPPPEYTRRPFFQHPDPDLSDDIGEEKAASWLELFYDLFYVATLTEFTHVHHFMDWAALGLYTQWFIITWWAWCASSLYTARFDTDDVVHHIYKLIEMCAVIGMAGSSDYFLNSHGYIYGYIALKAVLVIEYAVVFVVALLARSKSRIALSFYVGANVISIVLWASSIAIIDTSFHRVLWYVGIFIEVMVNVIVRSDKSLSWAASNLAERLGLLTLIVLGENLMGLVRTVTDAGTSIYIVISNFMAVVIVFGFFFMYFEDFNKQIFLHARYHQIWVYLHFPLHLCQVAFGIALMDTMRIYKEQLVADGLVKDEKKEAAKGGEGDTTASHGTPTEGETPAHKLAKRAIDTVNPSLANTDYNPMTIDTPTTIRWAQPSPVTGPSRGYLTLAKSIIVPLVMTTIQAAMWTEPQLLDQPKHSLQYTNATHTLVRRAPSAEGGAEAAETTVEQRVFIYKAFLMFSGLLLIINSFIKMINTRIADLYGKIIIGSRIINAIALWAMCAIPFETLDAIVLLSVLVGSLVLQGMVDLLD